MKSNRLFTLLLVVAGIVCTSAALLHAGGAAGQPSEPATFDVLGVTVEMHTMGVLPTALLCVGVLAAVVTLGRWSQGATRADSQN